MNFQLKLYQLIKPRLRDQKYEISSGSSLLSFESDWYSGKQPVARCCCSLPLGQPLLCSRHFHSTARQGLADWSPPLFIWGIGSSWGTSNNPGVEALLTGNRRQRRFKVIPSYFSPTWKTHPSGVESSCAKPFSIFCPCQSHWDPQELLPRNLHPPSTSWTVLVGCTTSYR